MKFLSSTTHEIIHVAPSQPPRPPPTTTPTYGDCRDYVTIVLPVVVFGLVFALALNGVIRCFLGRRRNGRPKLLEDAAGAWVMAARSAVFVPGLVKMVGTAAECTICLSEFNTGEEVRILSVCQHGFHGKCIEEWLCRHATCPNCRTTCCVSRSSAVFG